MWKQTFIKEIADSETVDAVCTRLRIPTMEMNKLQKPRHQTGIFVRSWCYRPLFYDLLYPLYS